MAGNIPRIKEFPNDDRYWRIDAFGAIVRNHNIPSEPFIQLVITPFNDNNLHLLEPKELISTGATDDKGKKTIEIGVGQLPFVSIGSIWKNGLIQSFKAGTEQTLYSVNIIDENIQIINGNHQIDGKYLIPPNFYKLGIEGLNTKFIAIKDAKGDPFGILVPAIEIIRFYYALSTHLSHAVFSGAFKHNIESIINSANSGNINEESRCVLHLRKHITDEEGWIIGRILNSDFAFQGANQPYDDMLQNSINRKWMNVTSNFPFRGLTTLKARTKRICSITDNGWRTLILELERCTAPFPFDNTTFPRDNDNNTEADPNNKLPPEEKKSAWGAGQGKESNGSKAIQNKQEPNKDCSSETITLPTNRFAAIEGKKPDKPVKEQCRYMSAITSIQNNKEPDNLSTGQPAANGAVTARGNAVPQRSRTKALPASFKTFKAAVELLNSYKDITACERPLNDLIRYVPLTKSSRYRQWSYLDSEKQIRRNVITANIEFQGKHYILLELESRKGESFKVALINVTSGVQITDIGLNQLLEKLAYEKGIWAETAQYFRNLKMITLKHTWKSVGDFCKTIIRKLD